MASRDFKQRVIFELVDEASRNAKRIDDALAGLSSELGRADKAATRSQSSLSKFGDFLRTRFVVTFGDVQRAVSAAFDTIQQTITLEGQEQALRGQLASIGVGFDEYIAKLDQAAAGTVSTADLIESSSRALLLGIPAEEIANLLEIAGSRAQATGQSVAKAFEDITTGIGRASPLILDNLGFVISLEEAYDDYARTLGKSREQLSKAEQSQALLNQVLEQGARDFDELGTAADNAFVVLQQGQAELENFTTTAGQLATGLSVGVVSGLVEFTRGLTRVGITLVQITRQIVALAREIPGLGNSFGNLEVRAATAEFTLRAYEQSLIQSRDALGRLANEQTRAALGFDNTANSAAAAAAQTNEYTRAAVGAANAAQRKAEVADDLGTAYEEEERRLGDLVRANDRYAESAARAARQAESLTRATGGSLTARDRRSQQDVDDAIAAGRQAFLGGTRIRTADGSGSRLLR